MNHRPFVVRGTLAAVMVGTLAVSVAAQGRVGGTVKGDNGQPIKGATITAHNPDAQPDSFTTTTDDKGRFAMVGLPRGDWSFWVQAPGYMPEGGTVTVRAIQFNPPFAFTLRKASTAPSALGSLEVKDLQAQLTAAETLYNNQRWDEAIAAYRAVLTKAPALSFINLQIAGAYRQKKAFDSAIEVYTALLKADPGNDRAKVGIAMTNVEKGDVDAAERTLEAAAQTARPNRDVLYSLGEVKLAKSKTDEAVQAYQRAAAADPNWGKPVFALGRVAMSRDQKTDAQKYFEKVVEVDPMSPEAAQARTTLEQLRRP